MEDLFVINNVAKMLKITNKKVTFAARLDDIVSLDRLDRKL